MSMLQSNSSLTEFFLVGFQNLNSFKIPLFLLLIITYIMAISGNLLIVVLVSTSHLLRSPMYFFLCHLSICDFVLCSSVIPKTLNVIIHGGSSIPFLACFIQFYIFGSCLSTECYLLTAMSYDRYVAICHPLSYILIMNFNICLYLAASSWLAAFFISIISLFMVYSLNFCGPNTIDHIYCDLSPILELSCSDTFVAKMGASLLTTIIVIFPFVFVIVTYVYIFTTILGITSNIGKQKAFSTCSSHLSVVCAFYGSLISIYFSPSKGNSLNTNKVISLLYTLFTPLFNPVIYTLRNQIIRKTVIIFFKRISQLDVHSFC
ncbi:olfactory receptor 10A3-like [Rana temporaria]|uniref:olfactory receptor 10A3-like n=1 Tax=Rana temporaria TaxID=8407 RepID=UPI001AAD6247|nr:olfactory receptor 10A3-like [Rana temporaria]